MRKFCFLILFTLAAINSFAQKGKQVQLTSSESFKGFTKQGVMRILKPIFSQEGSTLTADSADFNQNANTFDAFGNVVITQPNGTTIYSDLLNYNGTTRQAILTNNVRLNDRGTLLTTNFLTYNLGTRIGTYLNGGRIDNQGDILTSKNGYYFATTQDAYFRYDVVVNTADAIIKTDTLKYNTANRIAYFYGPTNIKGKKDRTNLYTENGNYNTLTGQAYFGKRNTYTDGSKTLKGDSLYYDRRIGNGRAIGRVTFIDTVQKSTLRGDIGVYNQRDESAFVTGHAYVILETKQDSNKVDSIYMTADTLRTKLILLKDLRPANEEELKSNEEVAQEEQTAEGAAPEGAPANTSGDTQPATSSTGNSEQETVQETPAEQPENEEKKKPAKKKRGLLGIFNKKKTAQQDSVTNIGKPTSEDRKTATLPASRDSVTADSVTLAKAVAKNPALDTARTRIVLAYHKVKIFKSDLQTKSDSAFYSYADSIIRCYKSPIIWTQGSQLSADTIFLKLKNQRLDNMLLQHNGFIASTQLDSSKFNQVKGKVLTGIFKDNKLYQMYVDGNAESIYYTVEDSAYSGMNRTLSSRMRLQFENNKVQEVMVIRKPEGKYHPIEKINKDDEILKGFIWKPNERPKSKEEILGIKRTTPVKRKVPATKPAATSTQKKKG
ncbi:OstA-like protein [Desertivirga brevis]|uniref:OstA-like protein n=1 Tax=Desertivirga brevis TaxID=2810310 RepID=UPI001A95C514